MTTKRVLGWYTLLLIVFLSGKTYTEFRSVSAALTDTAPQVLGTTTRRLLSEPPVLPPYPVLKQAAPKFAAYNYTLYDVESGTFLVEQAADQPVPLASTTKIMTATLALEQGDLDTVALINQKSAWQIGSTVNLLPNEQLTLRSLLYAALLNSGNDAAFSIADMIGKQQYGADQLSVSWDDSIAQFVTQMNDKASQLNLGTLRFSDPSGLEETNVGSAKDMAKLTAYALKNDTFRRIVSTGETTVTDVTGAFSHPLKNSNRLVSEWGYPGAIGVKTGFTPEAGHNLIGAITWQDHTLIAVVFHTYADTNTASAEVARDLLDYAQRAIEWR